MSDRTQRALAVALTALLAACAAIAGLSDVPASWHRIAEIVLAVGGAIGTALLPGVRVPGVKTESELQ